MKPFVLVVIATECEQSALVDVLAEHYPTKVHNSPDEWQWLVEMKSCMAVVTRLEYMGSLQSSIEISHQIAKFRPALVISAGICAMVPYGTKFRGGDSNQPNPRILDLVISQTAIFYEPEKRKPTESESRARIYKGVLDKKTIESLIHVYENLKKQYTWRGNVQIGSVLSGEKVVADRDKTDSLRAMVSREHGEQPKALEMEYSGIAASCTYAGRPHLLIKAGCDFADSDKNDEYQQDAATMSLVTCFKWLETLNENTVRDVAFQSRGRIKSPPNPFHTINNALICFSSGLPPRGYPSQIIEADEKDTADYVTPWEYHIQKALYLKLADDFDWICAEEDWVIALEGLSESRNPKNDCYADVPIRTGKGLIIDPLDGTLNFKDGRPEVAISVAEVQDNEVVTAFVSMPYRNILVCATKNNLTVNGESIERAREKATQLSCATVSCGGDLKKLKQKRSEAEAVLSAMAEQCENLRISGALAYDLCALALGEIDARVSTSAKVEDVATGLLLVKSIGGKITTLLGKPIDLSKHNVDEGVLAACTVELHGEILEKLPPDLMKADVG